MTRRARRFATTDAVASGAEWDLAKSANPVGLRRPRTSQTSRWCRFGRDRASGGPRNPTRRHRLLDVMLCDVAAGWLLPEEVLALGFEQSSVVMMNELHNGHLRCVAHRLLGRRLLPLAHRLGVRRLAMEALWRTSMVAERCNESRRVPDGGPEDLGYLSHPEMRAFAQSALDLGWELLAYEADVRGCPPSIWEEGPMSSAFIEWREAEQARNLADVVRDDERLLVWCGMGHHQKLGSSTHGMMGYRFIEFSGITHFAIDQVGAFLLDADPAAPDLPFSPAGYLCGDPPPGFRPWPTRGVDACIVGGERTLE